MSNAFPLGNPANPDWFAGEVHMAALEESAELQAANVTFEPGGRTNWHTHQVGQLMIVVEGEGFYQEEDGRPRLISAGDTAWAGPGVNHWHGATRDSRMVHVVANLKDANGDFADWGHRVTDEQYDTAHRDAGR